jgi:F-type H+-transporting ATPase subunit b
MHLLHEAEFWVLVAFVIFVAGVWKPMRRAIDGALDARANRIAAELDEARRLRDEAEALLAEYQQKQREAEGDAQAIIAHAKEEAELLAARAQQDLQQALERRTRLAEERITQAEAKAVDEIRAAAVDVAIAAARDVIASGLDENRRAALVDAAITALPQALR